MDEFPDASPVQLSNTYSPFATAATSIVVPCLYVPLDGTAFPASVGLTFTDNVYAGHPL